MYIRFESIINKYVEVDSLFDDLCKEVEFDTDGNILYPVDFKNQREEELKILELLIRKQDAHKYLSDTSWIWEKYNRNVLVLENMSKDDFYTKYIDIINKQEEFRALIN